MKRVGKLITVLKHFRQVREVLATQAEMLAGGHGADALGGLTKEETKALCEWVRNVPEGSTVLEFGTLFGLTTLALAEVAPRGVIVETIDNFCWNPFGLPPELHQNFTQRILRPYLNAGRVKLVAHDSKEFRANFKGPVPALVFFDADHRYEAVRDEIAWAKQVGIPCICGHDYGNSAFGVTRAVDEAFPQGVTVKGMVWRADWA